MTNKNILIIILVVALAVSLFFNIIEYKELNENEELLSDKTDYADQVKDKLDKAKEDIESLNKQYQDTVKKANTYLNVAKDIFWRKIKYDESVYVVYGTSLPSDSDDDTAKIKDQQGDIVSFSFVNMTNKEGENVNIKDEFTKEIKKGDKVTVFLSEYKNGYKILNYIKGSVLDINILNAD